MTNTIKKMHFFSFIFTINTTIVIAQSTISGNIGGQIFKPTGNPWITYHGTTTTGGEAPAMVTNDELSALVQYLNNNGSVDIAGGKLKETGTTHWNAPNDGATDSVGFRALPGGARNNDGNGTFEGIGASGYWWLSTQVTMGASYNFSIVNNQVHVIINYASKSAGFSVRCIRDW